MTDGERAVSAEVGVAAPELSQQQTDSQTSASAEVAESQSDSDNAFGEVLKSLQKQVSQLEKRQQSTKDKQLSNTQKELSQVKEAVVNLTKLVQSGASSSQVSRGNEESGEAASLVQEMFVLAGIAEDVKAVENSPAYLSFFAANGGNLDVSKAANYLKTLRGSQKTPLSAGAIAQSAGGTAATPPDTDDLSAKYAKLASDPVANFAEMQSIKKQMQEAGAWK